MIRRRTLGIGAALAFLGSAALLVSGHALLNWPENGLPIGTLLAGVMVASLGAMPLALARPGGWAARIAKTAFGLAIAWLPLSLLLAGNLRLNFEGGWRSDAATWLGMAVLLALVVAGVAAVASLLAARFARKT